MHIAQINENFSFSQVFLLKTFSSIVIISMMKEGANYE